MSARVGVVLSGCGVFDGSEIHEAVSILIALDKRKAKIICMAPNTAQSETINHRAKKPIGLACIAPVLAARVLGNAGLQPKLTIGTDKGTVDAIHAMKAEHQNTGETDICVDERNRLVTTPCYMNHVGPWTVYQGA